MAKVPLIATQTLSEFGDLLDSAEFSDPGGYDKDLTYVPGFSELRRQHETQKAAYFRGLTGQGPRLSSDEVPTLPVNLCWTRMQSKDGQPDNTMTVAKGVEGYRLVTKADVGQDWLTELPGGAMVQGDGSIRNGDTVLMVTTRERAATNEMRHRLETERRTDGAHGSFQRAIDEARRASPGLDVRGLAPTIEVLPPTEREASLPPQPVSVKAKH